MHHRLRPSLIALLPLAALLFAACGDDDLAQGIRGSGNLVRQTIDVTDIDRLEISSAFQVEIRDGPAAALIEVDDNLLDRVVATNRDGLLRLALQSGTSVRSATLRATVTMPALSSVQASGAARVDFIDAIPTPDDLRIEIAGASHLEGMFSATHLDLRVSGASEIVGLVGARSATIDASGASRVDLIGVVDELEIELSGASAGHLPDFETRLASIDLTGASSLDIRVTERITRANLTGASHLTYTGNAVIDSQSLTGASDIDRR